MEPKQVKFIADQDVYEHLQAQTSIKAYLHELIRRDMGTSESVEARLQRLEKALEKRKYPLGNLKKTK